MPPQRAERGCCSCPSRQPGWGHEEDSPAICSSVSWSAWKCGRERGQWPHHDPFSTAPNWEAPEVSPSPIRPSFRPAQLALQRVHWEWGWVGEEVPWVLNMLQSPCLSVQLSLGPHPEQSPTRGAAQALSSTHTHTPPHALSKGSQDRALAGGRGTPSSPAETRVLWEARPAHSLHRLAGSAARGVCPRLLRW